MVDRHRRVRPFVISVSVSCYFFTLLSHEHHLPPLLSSLFSPIAALVYVSNPIYPSFVLFIIPLVFSYTVYILYICCFANLFPPLPPDSCPVLCFHLMPTSSYIQLKYISSLSPRPPPILCINIYPHRSYCHPVNHISFTSAILRSGIIPPLSTFIDLSHAHSSLPTLSISFFPSTLPPYRIVHVSLPYLSVPARSFTTSNIYRPRSYS